jgi:hypothetical protein
VLYRRPLWSLKLILCKNFILNDFGYLIQAAFTKRAARKLKKEVAFYCQICWPNHPNLTNIRNQGVHQGCVPLGQRTVQATNILWRVGWYTPLIRRVIVRMIWYISSYVTHSHLISLTHRQQSAISDSHTLQHTVARALGSFAFTSRLLATDLNTETTAVSHSKY